MITKERLKELIEQGEIIYEVVYNYDEDKVCEYDLKNIPTYSKTHLDHFLDLHIVFEAKADAEWYKEFGCIERAERLELPTWEEFKNYRYDNKKGFVSFKSKNNDRIWMCQIKSKKIYINIYNKSTEEKVFSKELTEENYILACRKCKELFLGEEE